MIILKMGGIELNDDFSCDDCPLLQWEDDCGFCSGFNEDGAYGRYLPEHYGGKDIYPCPDWCPLEELPEPLEPSSEDTKAFEEEFAEWHLVKWNKGFREGWNCCLGKIGGNDGHIQDNA